MDLTDQHRAILDLEGSWWRHPARKVDAIRELGLTEARHYQILNALLESPEALAYAPLTVRRLLRLRDLRRSQRSEAVRSLRP